MDKYEQIDEVLLNNFGLENPKAPFDLLDQIFDLPDIEMHSVEHHYIVPAVLLSVVGSEQNISKEELKKQLAKAKERAKDVPCGVCGTWGSCGAAIGVGIATSIMLNTTTMSQESWKLANKSTARALGLIAKYDGPRCCKRSTYLALESAICFYDEKLNITGIPYKKNTCKFFDQNPDCKKEDCPFYPIKRKKHLISH